MKKFILFLFLFPIVPKNTSGQISTSPPFPVQEKAVIPYDSLNNFLGNDPFLYIGQTLYVKGKPEMLRKYGYDNFVNDYKKNSLFDEKNVYGYEDRNDEDLYDTPSYYTPYFLLAEKYFKVVDVFWHSERYDNSYLDLLNNNELYLDLLNNNELYLELVDLENNNKLYFKFDAEYEHNFPFIVVGFYEKQKELLIGEKFIFRNAKNSSERTKWTLTDIVVEEEFYDLSVVLESNDKEKIMRSFSITQDNSLFTEKEDSLYRAMFGDKNWNTILNRDVNVGFTKEMVILALGVPDSIKKSSTGDIWEYSSWLIVFKENKILSFTQL